MKLVDAFSKLVLREGDTLSMDPMDPGNWTTGHCNDGTLKGSKYGISAAAHPDVDIASLTAEDAMSIYQRCYWDPIWGDQLPDAIAYEIFDEAVNSGVSGAVKVLQGALGVGQDGKFGPTTFAALNAADLGKLNIKLNAARLEFYTTLAAWPSQGKGWVRRVAMNLRGL